MVRRNQRPLVIGLIVGGASLAVIMAGCCGAFLLWPTSKTGNQHVGRMTRDEFKQKYTGQTKETILKELGKPSATDQNIQESWTYRGSLTYDPISGKSDSWLVIWFNRQGIAEKISFH